MRNDGTWATYQGIPCLQVSFRRTRGVSADTSTVTIPASPAATLRVPARAELLAPIEPAPVPPGLEAVLAESPSFAVAELPSFLRWEGDLVLAEDASQPLVIPGLIVVSIERDTIDSADDELDVLRLTLADQRLLWARGLLGQWTYNALRTDGTVRRDTLRKLEGEPRRWRLNEIASEVVGYLPREPRIGQTPVAWSSDEREVRFERRALAAEAAATLATLGGAVEPCLDLDGRVSFYRPGDGRVGWAAGGSGPNAQDLPDAEIAGRGFSREQLFPEQWVVVVGRERVATVALDDCEPVLWIEGAPVLLSEELVRELTGGRYGLGWLRKLVLLPGTEHGARGVSPDVVDTLAKQAWRYWRVRGVETIEGGKYTGDPGPNAHLLPLRDRAETADSARLPVSVECYGWETRTERVASTRTEKLDAANRKLATIREEARQQRTVSESAASAVSRSLFGTEASAPLDQHNPEVARTGGNVAALSFREMNGGRLLPADLNAERVDTYLRVLRRAELLKESGRAATAEEYVAAYRERVAAEAELSPGAAAEFALASELAKLERESAEATFQTDANQRDTFLSLYTPRVKRLIEEASRDARLAREAAAADQARRDAGLPDPAIESVYLFNKARRPDAGAQVVSAELGVVRTSGLAGWVADESVGHPAQTSFVPRAVRVLFGAALRPRIDITPGQLLDRVLTGGAIQRAATGGGQDVIPQVLSEQESHYESAWLRVAPGRVQQVKIEDVPMSQATRVERRWRELVPLPPGRSNREQLDADAQQIALQLSRRPDQLTGALVEAVGPWPVQCDGVVSGVTITLEQQGGAPCGFTTLVQVGGEGTVPVETGTRERRA